MSRSYISAAHHKIRGTTKQTIIEQKTGVVSQKDRIEIESNLSQILELNN